MEVTKFLEDCKKKGIDPTNGEALASHERIVEMLVEDIPKHIEDESIELQLVGEDYMVDLSMCTDLVIDSTVHGTVTTHVVPDEDRNAIKLKHRIFLLGKSGKLEELL